MLASLKMIGRIQWIDREKLRCFILACQDEETGGFADRPGDMVSKIFSKKTIHTKISTGNFKFCLSVTQLMVQVGFAKAAVYSGGRIG